MNKPLISKIVIPARLASTRLPEKLLLKETGCTVLEHTYLSARRAKLPQGISIAVDDERLFNEAQSFGARPIMTNVNCQSGTDRVAEVSSKDVDVDIWVNVQGDEPEIEGEYIDRVLQLLIDNPTADVATLATPIRDRSHLEDPSCVKVVLSHDGLALYFSRSVIPHPRTWSDDLLHCEPSLFLQHLGIYAYRREFLNSLAKLPSSTLETTEKLEQLRFLQAGNRIAVGVVDRAPRGIDTRSDYDAFVQRHRAASSP